MPGYDGKGPQGTGPFGRGMGPCGQGGTSPRQRFLSFRRGWRGRGGGFRWFQPFPTIEKEDLETEKNWLNERLDAINRRIDDLSQGD